MKHRAHDLLTDPLIRVRRSQGGPEALSLPEVLAVLARGEDGLEFRQLQTHQEPAWHAFLVQIAAMATARSDSVEVPTQADTWRRLLIELSNGSAEAWHLVVADLQQPAFLQPPVPEGEFDPLKKRSWTPEAIGVLVTAKNHDIKAARYQNPAPDDWIYALVTLQTTEGYSGGGGGYRGISRMNKGLGSRPQVAATTGLGWSERYRRDLNVCLDIRQGLLGENWDFLSKGLALLWIPPWDGRSQLSTAELDPFFVEICRRVRLKDAEDGIEVHWGTSKVARVDAEDRLGHLGDPWTPIRRKDSAALTVSERGFDYRLLSKLLFSDDFEPAPAQAVGANETGTPSLVARVLVRGQGQTGGYHERVVPLHKRVARHFAVAEGRAQLGTIAESRIEQARDAQLKVLKPAVLALHQGAPDKLSFKDPAADPYVAELDAEVDRIFFEHLWADFEEDSNERERRWHSVLFSLSKGLLEQAIDRAPHPDSRHYQGLAAAERTFNGAARKHLRGAFASDAPGHAQTKGDTRAV